MVVKAYTGFFKRCIANFVDWIFVTILCLPVGLVLGKMGVFAPEMMQETSKNVIDYYMSHEKVNNMFISWVMYAVVSVLFTVTFICSKLQASPGKWLLKVKVTDEKLERVKPARAFLRQASFQVVIILTAVFCAKVVVAGLLVSGNEKLDVLYETKIAQALPKFDTELKNNNVKFSEFAASIISPTPYLDKELTVKLKNLFEQENKAKTQKLKGVSDEVRGIATNTVALIFILPFSVTMLVYILWYSPIWFTREKLATHDIIAKTRVVTFVA